MRVFAATHGDNPIANAQYLARLQLNAVRQGRREGGLGDDEGDDHISDRHPTYAELTGLYWAWKNVTDETFGLCQYRRYFSPILTPQQPVLIADLATVEAVLSIDPAGVIFMQELALADMIVPQPVIFPMSLEHQYIGHHKRPQDWFAMIAALTAVHPREAEGARQFFAQTNEFTHCNMFIGRRPAIHAHCEWLFPILNEVERLTERTDDPMGARVCGFVAERLFTWWLHSRGPSLIRRPLLLCQ